MVDSGTFREDLLYRLNTIHLEIPPLRERGNDIHLFIDYFMQRYAAKYEKKDISLHEHALEKLCSYHWPGNIRELQHAIEKAIILCEGNVIRPKDIFVKQTWNPQFSTTVPNLEEVERQAIATAIRQNDGNLTATAEQLGISRQTLYNKIKTLQALIIMVFSKHLYMVILSYILLIIAVAGAGIALVITHTALILGSLLFIFSLFLIGALVKRLNKFNTKIRIFLDAVEDKENMILF